MKESISTVNEDAACFVLLGCSYVESIYVIYDFLTYSEKGFVTGEELSWVKFSTAIDLCKKISSITCTYICNCFIMNTSCI